MDSERSGQAFEEAAHGADLDVSSSSPLSGVEWAVGAVSDRLGLSPATLRTWDRRYGIGPSQRTEGGHRRYTEEDIRRVRVMARFTARGVPAQSAARVALSMDRATRAALCAGTPRAVNRAMTRTRRMSSSV